MLKVAVVGALVVSVLMSAVSVVYVKQDSDIPSFEYREIILGEQIGKNYVVLEGLVDGERVVTNGAFVIDASAQLNNQASMMNQLVVGNERHVQNHDLPDYSSRVPSKFKDQLERSLQEYLKLKEVS